MNLERILEQRFGHSSFRVGQKEIITDVLDKKNVLALLPTGGGKSICYLLPGYILTGVVIVVSPLISLMQDQVEQLKANGEKRVVALNGFLSPVEREQVLNNLSSYRFIYVSPEMLQNNKILDSFKRLLVSLFVVDEAHCISQWGHEFRTDYLKLGFVIKSLGKPPCLALTATANETVRHDIITHLGLSEVTEHIYSIDRPNIAVVVERFLNYTDKLARLIELIRNLNGPGIIYFSSRSAAEAVANQLTVEGIGRVAFYHGGLEAEDRMLIQQQFVNGQLHVICSTNAFGMGIDKPDVRFVIHFHYPGQMESYIQEIGRAGRDGKQSIAILLHSPTDDELTELLLEREFPDKSLLEATIQKLVQISAHTAKLTYADEIVVMDELGLTETNWRFIKFHLEELNILQGTTVNQLVDPAAVFRRIWGKVVRRQTLKRQKLSEMREWLSSNTCRRTGFLRLFGEERTERPAYCCDHCGMILSDFYIKKEKHDEEIVDWRRELQLLLHQSGR